MAFIKSLALVTTITLGLFGGQGSHALMFQSDAVTSQWDTWAFVENGTYYAYYLITENSPGEGFGVATSGDGQHWEDHGFVWHGPSWVNHRWWEGTGAVWRAADFNTTGRYVINYSECPGKYQNITFAESFDLIHWSQPSPFNSTYFNIDTTYYKNPGRWDCIFSIASPDVDGGPNQRDGYPRYGFWTASPIDGTMGFGITQDGWDWTALPSPQMFPVITAEVGGVEFITYGANNTSGKYFAILGQGGQMVTYSSDKVTGPYYAAPTNYLVLSGACYFSRFFRNEKNQILITHQSYSHTGHTYIAPYKYADVDNDGTLRFKYWSENDGFKGNTLPLIANTSSPYFATAANVSKGLVLQTQLKLSANETQTAMQLPGVMFELQNGIVTLVSITPTGACVISEMESVNANTSIVKQTWDRDLTLPLQSEVALRILYRRDMIELYLNDFLLPVYLMSAAGSGKFGFLINEATPQFSGASAWTMNLNGTANWPDIPKPPPGDLAVTGKANCSGHYRNMPAYDCPMGNDGDLNTRWSSPEPYDGSPQWFSVDMGKPTEITSVRLVWEFAYASGYDIQTSNEVIPTTWTTVYSTTTGHGGTENFNVKATSRHFRLYCTQRYQGSPYGFSIFEMMLFNTTTTTVQHDI